MHMLCLFALSLSIPFLGAHTPNRELASHTDLFLEAACEMFACTRSLNEADSVDNVVVVTKANFDEEVLASPLPVVADFYSMGCGHCRHLAPTFSALSVEMEGLVKFVKIDTRADRELTQQFKVRALPTLVFFKDGVEAGRHVGSSSRDILRKKIEATLLK